MKYLVVHYDNYEGSSLKYFETRTEADAYLCKQSQGICFNSFDYELIEYTQKFDVDIAISKYNSELVQKRKTALDKLTEVDKIVLGIS